jgi:high-affinity K+ transport system ATPase subunit B
LIDPGAAIGGRDFVAVALALVAFIARYGAGGLIAPFVGIELIDPVVHGLLGA